MSVDDTERIRFGARLRHPREASRMVRRSDRPRVADLPKATEVMDTLITPAGERHVTVLETAASAGGSGGSALYTLPRECEVCFVLSASIEVQVEDEIFELAQGDAMTFGAAVPH